MVGVDGLQGVTGGSIPAAIWRDFMMVATRDLRVRGFPAPSLGAYDPPSYRSPYELGLAPYVPPPAPTPEPDEDGGDGTGDDGGHSNGNGGGHGNGNGNGNGNGRG